MIPVKYFELPVVTSIFTISFLLEMTFFLGINFGRIFLGCFFFPIDLVGGTMKAEIGFKISSIFMTLLTLFAEKAFLSPTKSTVKRFSLDCSVIIPLN